MQRATEKYEWRARMKLGEGAYGKVYLAHHKRPKEARAIKFVNAERGTDWEREKQFGNWDHPNIVRVYEVIAPRGETNPNDGRCVFVMAAADMDLRSFIFRRTAGAPSGQAREISLQCTRGLSFLHDKGVLHRDLKPGNVLLYFGSDVLSRDAGQTTLHVWLADFGFAREQQGAAMTALVQTLGYRAPEILLAQEHVDEGVYTAAIDVWSLGCIFYEVVTGDAFGAARSELESLQLFVSALGPCPCVTPWKSHQLFRFLCEVPAVPSGPSLASR